MDRPKQWIMNGWHAGCLGSPLGDNYLLPQEIVRRVLSHVVTEEGVAYPYKAEGQTERRSALAAVAGVSPIGLKAKPEETAELRKRGIVAYPEDIGVQRLQANRSLLAARSMEDLVAWSGGLYTPPPRFRSW
jgi:malonate decarboxylase alpha subunit